MLKKTADLPAARQKLAAWWPSQQHLIKSPPRIGVQRAIQYHLQLHPIYLNHLRLHSISHTAATHTIDISPRVEMPSHTHLTNLAFYASHDITSPTPSPTLSKLIRQISHTAAPVINTSVRQLSTIWQTIQSKKPPPPFSPPASPTTPPPYNIQNLIALYNKLDVLIIVLSSPVDLFLTDWTAVWKQVQADGYTELYLTTPDQFRLILHHYGALDVRLLSYDHLWGNPLIDSLQPTITDICYAAARYASNIQFHYFSDHYFYDPITKAHGEQHIHDLQNKLLNLQLQNEILARLKLISPHKPATPIPGRDASHAQRFQAIYQHLTWWVEHYLAQATHHTLK